MVISKFEGYEILEFDSMFDIYFDKEVVAKISQLQKDLIVRFAYLSKKSGKYVYSIDNTRFTNHSSDPNVVESEEKSGDDAELSTIAIRDIQIGDEITMDYRAIDAVDEGSDEGYLKK